MGEPTSPEIPVYDPTQSLEKAVLAFLVPFLVQVANAAVKIIDADRPEYLALLCALALWGVVYWYGVDIDIPQFKKGARKPAVFYVLPTAILMLSFMGLPVSLQSDAALRSPGYDAAFRALLIAAIIQTVGLVGWIVVLQDERVSTYYQDKKRFWYLGAAVVLDWLAVIAVSSPEPRGGFTAGVICFVIGLLISEAYMWTRRSRTAEDHVPNPELPDQRVTTPDGPA